MDKNKPFGLILPKRAQKFQAKAKSIFESDSDDDQPQKKKSCPIPQAKPLKQIVKEEVEDPSIYEYDTVYDDMKAKEVAKNAPKENKPSRYIDSLLKAASKRKKEYERRVDRKVQVEREKEGDEFKDKEAFVTSAYKKKMEELEEEEERERRENQINDLLDVTKQNDLSGFYRHFLKQSVGEEKVPQFGKSRISDISKLDKEKNKHIVEKEKKLETVEKEKKLETVEKEKKLETVEKEKKLETVEKETEIKQEPLSDSEQPQQSSKCNFANTEESNENLDQDSDFMSSSDAEEPATSEKHQFKNKSASQKKRNIRRHDSSSSEEEDTSVDISKKKNNFVVLDTKHASKAKEHKSLESAKKKTITSDSESSSSGDEDGEQNAALCNDESDSESSLSANKKKVTFVEGEKQNKSVKAKVNVYAKRTVDDAFSAAQARYFQRMAQRSN